MAMTISDPFSGTMEVGGKEFIERFQTEINELNDGWR
jgi:hypothetical protein